MRTPVVIVGAGPVGMVLALFLDRHGVASTVFNVDTTSRWHPKGNTHNARTMEHYRRLGISPAIRQLGLPFEHPTDVAYFTRFSAWEIARLRMPSEAEKQRAVAEADPIDQVPEPLHRGNQMYVERYLLAYTRTRPRIAMRLGWQVTDVDQDDDGVTVVAHEVNGDGRETWRSSYVVGCDGGRSIVRRGLGISYEGHGTIDQDILGGRATATHLRLPSMYTDFFGDQPAWLYWSLNKDVAMVLQSLNGADEFMLVTSSIDPDRPDDAAVRRLLYLATGTEIPVEVLGHRGWTPGAALVAESFGHGRAHLAGDAAHLFTPTGGFGMNTGIDDAANLSWKLAAMVRGWGGGDLMASYEAERRPVAYRNTAAARELNNNLGAISRPAALDDDSSSGEAARQALSRVLMTMGEEFASIGVQLGARYDESPLIAHTDNPPADHPTVYEPSSVPGGRAPHAWLDDWHGPGSSLFDCFARDGFTLLRLGAKARDASALQAAFAERRIPLSTVDIASEVVRELYQCDLALVRPDQHVAWRGNRVGDDADAVVRVVAGLVPVGSRSAR
ncbi:MAG: FAD-dependent monooxygenase [Solirubrobacterales bacterium]